MENPKITNVNTENGVETIVDMTLDQLALWKLEKTTQDKKFAAQEASALAKAVLLQRLGITADEAKLLLA